MIKLNEILVAGEGYKIEFKESVDKTLVEEAVAFANATGGKILIGVKDNGIVKGTDISNAARSRIQDTLSQIKPHIDFDLEIIKNVIIIEINEGKNKPYACSKGFFIRMGANSQKLERDEIVEFFQAEGRYLFDQYVNKKIEPEKIIDDEIYDSYLKKANISNILTKVETLTNLNCVVEENGNNWINNTGILFFSNDPTKILHHAYVVCVLFKGIDKEYVLDRKELKGDIISNIEDTILFLKKHLNLRYEIKSLRREEILDIPETALRESAINAICHRDYFEKGAQVMVEIYDDRVVISNPGGIPRGIDAKRFGKISITRNPNIASMLQRANYIEKMGTGITRITNAMKSAGLPEPKFDIEDFFMVTLLRYSYIEKKKEIRDANNAIEVTDAPGNVTDVTGNVTDVTDNATNLEYDDLTIQIINIIKSDKFVTLSKIARETDTNKRTIQRKINLLKEKEKIKRVGNPKSGFWELIDRI